MKYERFEDLPVWRAAIELAEGIYALTRNGFFTQPGDLRDQLRRAALSVSNNIAEGFERGSTAELIAFPYIARGSAGEVRSMLRFVERASRAAHLKPEVEALIALAESCSRQIRAWAHNLQNTDIKGQRHLTAKSRQQYAAHRDAGAFLRGIGEMLHRHRAPTSSPRWRRRNEKRCRGRWKATSGRHDRMHQRRAERHVVSVLRFEISNLRSQSPNPTLECGAATARRRRKLF